MPQATSSGYQQGWQQFLNWLGALMKQSNYEGLQSLGAMAAQAQH